MTVVAGLRIAAAALVLAAVGATWAALPGPVNPFNFFGFFTIQSNLIGAGVAVAGGIRLLRRTRPTRAWSVVRWSTATYLVLVGVVYWALLAPLGAAGGVPLVWANLVVHGLTPVAALADWLLVRDRTPIPARALPIVLTYPLLWTAVVLVRGVTDGWVPYPFLSSAQGYPVVGAWVAAVAGTFAGVAALLRLRSR